jgi:hypothetical protein
MEEITFFIIMWTIKKSRRSCDLSFFLRKIIQILLNKELLFIFIFHKTWILTFNSKFYS